MIPVPIKAAGYIAIPAELLADKVDVLGYAAACWRRSFNGQCPLMRFGEWCALPAKHSSAHVNPTGRWWIDPPITDEDDDDRSWE